MQELGSRQVVGGIPREKLGSELSQVYMIRLQADWYYGVRSALGCDDTANVGLRQITEGWRGWYWGKTRQRAKAADTNNVSTLNKIYSKQSNGQGRYERDGVEASVISRMSRCRIRFDHGDRISVTLRSSVAKVRSRCYCTAKTLSLR